LYENLVGSTSVSDLLFARRALHVLSSRHSNTVLTSFLRDTYHKLSRKGIIETRITPDCGYFVFGLHKMKLSNEVAMNEEFFELKGYPNYVRINLMKAEQLYLKKRRINRATRAIRHKS
jgi:hypothetical protein